MAAKYEETMKAKGFFPYYMDDLPPKLIQKAKDELGETDEVRRSALEQFRKCILADKKLKCPTDDEFLITFLRARKYNVDNAMSLIKNFFNLITSHPEFYNLDKEKMDKLTSDKFISILPFRDTDGCLILINKMENWDPDEVNVQVLFCVITALIFCLEKSPANQISGVRLIFDAKKYTFKQLRCFVPRYITLISTALRNCLPIRFKGIHIVNEAVVFRYAWSIMKLVLSEKIKNRIYFHGENKKDIQKYIPKEILPLEYDGDYTNYNEGDWLTKELDKTYEWFSMMIKACFS